jgi:hypothetical protein
MEERERFYSLILSRTPHDTDELKRKYDIKYFNVNKVIKVSYLIDLKVKADH